jgi:nucleolar protein 14
MGKGRKKPKAGVLRHVKGQLKVSENPFEVRPVTHTKHDVLNRRVKGANRNVAKARSDAVQKRSRTLLKEWKDDRKANSFNDRRIGEGDPSLPLEEVVWARARKESTRRSRSSAFALGDSDDDVPLLTHKGKTLGEDVAYDSVEERSSDGEGGYGKDATSLLHFGGPGADKKSRKDLLDEVIAKSKQHKAEKSRQKETQEETREELDQEFGDLMGVLNLRPTKAEKEWKKDPLDEYDLLSREIAFESRVQATDRTKTEEEKAREEKERLEELEAKRVKRMRGEVDSSEDEGTKKGKDGRRKKLTEKVNNEEGDADDQDEFDYERSSSSSGGDDDSEDDDEGKSEGSDEEGDAVGSSEDEDKLESAASKIAKIKRMAQEEIPYILPCPQTTEELLSLLVEHCSTAADVNTVIMRIVKYHSVRANPKSSKEKLHNFYDVLLKRVISVGDQLASKGPGGDMDRELQLAALMEALQAVTHELPDPTGALCRRKIGQLQKKVARHQHWPSPGERVLLKVLGDIFPDTDLRHPVTTPAALYVGQCLSQCPVKCVDDLAAGVFLCALLLRWALPAQRMAHESVSFLTGLMALFGDYTDEMHVTTPSLCSSAASQLIPSLRRAAESFEGESIPSLAVCRTSTAAEVTPTQCAALYGATVSLLRKVIGALKDSPALPEMVFHLQFVLELPMKEFPQTLRDERDLLRKEMQDAVNAVLTSRQPLEWQADGVKSVKSLAPKFQEEGYTFSKDRTEVQQLKRQLKQEKKGAMRELRRDAEFLSTVADKAHEEKEAARRAQLRKNRAWLESEQASWNQQVGKKSSRSLIKGGGSAAKKKPRVGRR